MRDCVSFSQDAFHATIRLSYLSDLPIKNVCMIFSLMLRDERENEQAIRDTELYLENIVPENRAAWDKASVQYQREWRLIEKPTTVRQTKAQIAKTAAIRAHNDALIRAVKKAKRQYERWAKIQALWNDTKRKMNIK